MAEYFLNSVGSLERYLLQRFRQIPHFDTISVDRATDTFVYYLQATFRIGPHHYRRSYSLSENELHDPESLRRFIQIVEEDLRRGSARFAEEHRGFVDFRRDYQRVFSRELSEALDRTMVRQFTKPRNVEADRKAKELFVRIAGHDAFSALEAGRSIPIRGSHGGRYEMIKSFAYCIQDARRGYQLCAVVPDVPMYDHLLGIKLTIEHDEDRFLWTANKTTNTGMRSWFGTITT